VVFLFLASARKQRLYGRLAKTKGIGRRFSLRCRRN